MTDDIFNSANTDQELASELTTLKTKYTKEDGSIDIDGLLKAKAHSDRHIKHIETENTGMREDLKTRTTLEELIAKTTAPNNVSPAQQVNSQEATSEVDIEKRIEAKFSNLLAEQTHKQNIDQVTAELRKAWGNDYYAKAQAKARELGESEADLSDLAKRKPKVFLKLMLGDERTVFNPAPPANQYRPTTESNRSGTKTWATFQKLKAENPSAYWSIEVQKELHKLNDEYAARGEDFTKTK
jgi:hypothetical protein